MESRDFPEYTLETLSTYMFRLAQIRGISLISTLVHWMELNQMNSWVGMGTLFAGLVCLVVSSIVWKKSRKSVAPLLMSYLQEADDLADFNLAVEKALRSVVADTKATAGYVMLQNAGSDGQLQLASHYSTGKDFVAATSLGLDEGISGLCVSTKQSI